MPTNDGSAVLLVGTYKKKKKMRYRIWNLTIDLLQGVFEFV